MAIKLKDIYPTLNKTTKFVPQENYAILMDLRTGAHLPLNPYHAFLIALCNGKYSGEEILELAQSLDDVQKISEEALADFLKQASINYISLSDTRVSAPLALPDPIIFAKQAYQPKANPWDTGMPYLHPVELDLYLTEQCNLNCVYCFVGSNIEAQKDKLTHEELSDCLKQAAAFGILRCTLTGGEPTLHKGFEDLITQGASLGMHMVLATNGTKLSSETIKKLASSGIGSIQISLDALDSEQFGRLTRSSSLYLTVIEGIKEVVRSGIPVSIKAVLTKQNIVGVENLINQCVELGVKDIKLQNFEPGLAGRGQADFFITEEEAANLEALVGQKHRDFGADVKIALVLTGEKWRQGNFRPCRHALSGLGILANGDVTLCDRFGHDQRMVIGNVRDLPLSKIWRSQKHQSILNPQKDMVDEACRACPDFAKCRTGCFLYSLYAAGSVYATDPRCPKAVNNKTFLKDKINLDGRYLFCDNSCASACAKIN